MSLLFVSSSFFKKYAAAKTRRTLTCMVKTPSSWEDSFFICSARTWASSRIENSLSASLHPQDRAKHASTKAQERASEPPREPRSWSRQAPRPLGVQHGGFPAVRLAMMALSLCVCPRLWYRLNVMWKAQGDGAHTRKKNFKENYFYNFAGQSMRARSPRREAPPFPASDAATLWKGSSEESRSMRPKVV